MMARESGAAAVRRDVATGLIAVGAAAIVIAAWAFSIKAHTPIWGDGARVLAERVPPDFGRLLTPLHQHLHVVPILLWTVLRGPDQLLAALLVTHVCLAVTTGAFLMRRLGPVPGTAIALPLAMLGSAHFDLLMPWQIVFALPLLCGALATWLSIDRRRGLAQRLAVAALIVIAVASSNVGLFLVVALGLWFLLERRFEQLFELAPALLIWITWFVTIGISGAGDDGIRPSMLAIPYTAIGIAKGFGGVTGLGTLVGGAVLVGGLVWGILRGFRPKPALVGFGVAMIAMFALLSAVRSPDTVFTDAISGSRYTYLVGYFAAFALGAAAPSLPRSKWVLVVGALAAALNVCALIAALPMYP